MENVLCRRSKQPFSATNLNISKEVTITPVKNTENDIMSILKKLPEITFNVIQPEPVFKVPEIPRKVPTKKPKVVGKKKVLSEKQESYNVGKTEVKLRSKQIDLDKYEEFKKINLTQKQKQEKVQNNIPLVKNNNVGEIISRNTETASNKNTVSDKENIQRTSSPNRIPKKIELRKQISNNSIASSKVKTNSNNDSIINNTANNKEIKTSESTKDDYQLMDLPIEGQINVVSATFPPDYIDVSSPEYDKFVQGISKLPEDSSTQFDASQNSSDKESLAGQKSNFFPGFLDCIKMSLDIASKDDTAPQSHLAEGNVCSNFAKNIPEGNSTCYIKPVEEILPNSLYDSSNVKLDKCTYGIKRGQTENNPRKKQKIGNKNSNI